MQNSLIQWPMLLHIHLGGVESPSSLQRNLFPVFKIYLKSVPSWILLSEHLSSAPLCIHQNVAPTLQQKSGRITCQCHVCHQHPEGVSKDGQPAGHWLQHTLPVFTPLAHLLAPVTMALSASGLMCTAHILLCERTTGGGMEQDTFSLQPCWIRTGWECKGPLEPLKRAPNIKAF